MEEAVNPPKVKLVCPKCNIEVFPKHKRWILRTGKKEWTILVMYHCIRCNKQYKYSTKTTEDPFKKRKVVD